MYKNEWKEHKFQQQKNDNNKKKDQKSDFFKNKKVNKIDDTLMLIKY